MGFDKPVQLSLDFEFPAESRGQTGTAFNDPAFAGNKSLPIHRWVPWIAGFSKEFVEGVLSTYLPVQRGTLLDPFTGVGTTLVEGMLSGHEVIGFEINPYPFLATRMKLAVPDIHPEDLRLEIERFRAFYADAMQSGRQPLTGVPSGFQSRIPFYSPMVLNKVLTVLDFVATLESPLLADLFRMAFASTMVSYSNYSYEPSLATRASSGKTNIDDFAVGETVFHKLLTIFEDVNWFWKRFPQGLTAPRRLVNDSFFRAQEYLAPDLVDLIVTSPPYLNNYHYNRNTRPHLYWLGYAQHPNDLKALEKANFGTYWQTAREIPRVDLAFDLPSPRLLDQLNALRKVHPEKGIYGGNGWANYAATYFNDCLKFAQQSQYVLKPGGSAVVVIGNSILQGIMIPTDQYLAEIAEIAGLELVRIDIPRSSRVGSSIIQSNVRAVKAKSEHQLYEAVVILRKPQRR